MARRMGKVAIDASLHGKNIFAFCSPCQETIFRFYFACTERQDSLWARSLAIPGSVAVAALILSETADTKNEG